MKFSPLNRIGNNKREIRAQTHTHTHGGGVRRNIEFMIRVCITHTHKTTTTPASTFEFLLSSQTHETRLRSGIRIMYFCHFWWTLRQWRRRRRRRPRYIRISRARVCGRGANTFFTSPVFFSVWIECTALFLLVACAVNRFCVFFKELVSLAEAIHWHRFRTKFTSTVCGVWVCILRAAVRHWHALVLWF